MTTTLTGAGYIGDLTPSGIAYVAFHTHQTSMAPFALAGTPSCAVYKDDGLTQSTSGLTLSAEFDSVVGLQMLKIDTSADGTFYSTGSDFNVVMAAGTVNSISVVGYVVCRFSIGRGVSVNRLAGVVQSLTDLKDLADTGYDPATHGIALSTQGKANVNAEVVDALATDTYAEPAQGAPAATTTLAVKIGYLYKALRNKKTQTATTWSLFNDDASTVDHKSTVSNDGTTASFGEVASGP